ncbi:MAG: tRNA pseudouridine(38-40) synthase TruA [candidate division FCPU426 bacterium]
MKAVLEYDGTAFHGFQSQKNAVAVQNVLEEKLAVLLRHPVRVAGAGRTDAGVHARGQVISFDTETGKSAEEIQRGLNGLLPQTVRVRECVEAESIFDPRRDAQQKTYRYTWYNHPVASPFWRRYSWHAGSSLNSGDMQKAAQVLLGEHDFSSFRASGCSAKTPVRRILEIQVLRQKERVQLRITGHAFLHQMVRIIAGTLYDIGTGKRNWAEMQGILDGKSRKLAGKTAPAEGLILWEVRYAEIPRASRKKLDSKR